MNFNKKWLIPLAGIAVLGTAFLFTKGFLHIEQPKADISVGSTLLKEHEETPVEEVQATIQAQKNARDEAVRAQREAEEAAIIAQHEAEAAAQAEADEAEKQANFEKWCEEAYDLAAVDAFKDIFAGCAFLGDSYIEGVLTSDIAYPNSIFYKIGGDFRSMEDLIPQVAAYNPDKIFMYAGFNDIGVLSGYNEYYYERWADFITALQAACPGVPIYVNHLVPIQHTRVLEHAELYLDMPFFNGIIDQVAADFGLHVVETNDLVRQEWYYTDGYHMIYPFYPLWMRRMAENSGLM